MRPRILVGLAVMPLIAVGAVLAASHSVTAQSDSRPSLQGTEVFGPHQALPARPFRLRDQDGRLVSLRMFRGHVVALTFLDANCTRECPVAGRELAVAQRALGSRPPLTVLVVSVSPHNTPGEARAFAHNVGLTGRWHWLFGTQRQLAPVWRDYGILVKPVPTDIVHTAALYLIDQRGSVRVADGIPLIPDQLVSSVRALTRTHV